MRVFTLTKPPPPPDICLKQEISNQHFGICKAFKIRKIFEKCGTWDLFGKCHYHVFIRGGILGLLHYQKRLIPVFRFDNYIV